MKNFGKLLYIFSLRKGQKHHEMHVEELTLNTKDQGTITITLEENWEKTICCSLNEEELLSQVFWSYYPEKCDTTAHSILPFLKTEILRGEGYK